MNTTSDRDLVERAIAIILCAPYSDELDEAITRSAVEISVLGFVPAVTLNRLQDALATLDGIELSPGPTESAIASKVVSWVTDVKKVGVVERDTGLRFEITMPAERFAIDANEIVECDNGRYVSAHRLVWPSGFSLVF